jgi:ribosomal protein S11
VTIRVNVTNTTNTPKTVTQGTIHVIDSLGNTIATQTAIEGESVLINLTG